jgi:hypothetical protein
LTAAALIYREHKRSVLDFRRASISSPGRTAEEVSSWSKKKSTQTKRPDVHPVGPLRSNCVFKSSAGYLDGVDAGGVAGAGRAGTEVDDPVVVPGVVDAVVSVPFDIK